MAQILTPVSGSSLLNASGEIPSKTFSKDFYFIDWSKLKKVEDLITILAAVGFRFSPTHPAFETLKPLLDLEPESL